MKRLPRRCPCGKVRCNSIEHARQVHAQVWAERGGEIHIRIYRCPEGSYHWTRQLDPTPPHMKAAA